MAIFEQRQYRNPLDVLIAREEKTCKGCIYEQRVEAFEMKVWICKLDKKRHGTRCKSYIDRE